LSAIDCESGKTLKQEVHEAETRDDIVRTLGLCAFQLRASLGESRDSLRRFNQPLDQATSSSPEALQFLVLGYEKQLRGDISGALGYYQRAEEKDPKFALAYAAHGSGLGWLEQSDQALGRLSKAFELRDRLTIPSRFHVETQYYGSAHQQWDKELSIAQTWVQAFPHDIIARTNLRTSLTSLGRQNEALVQAREAARLLPSEPTLTNLLRSAIYAQQLGEARETYDEAKSLGFESLALHSLHALLAFLQNDKSEMQQEWAWASQDPLRGRFVLHLKSNTEVFYGHSRTAHRLALRNEESSAKAKLLSDAAIFESLEALRDAEIGNLRLSPASVADAVQKSQDRRVLLIAAMAFARAGNTQQSEKLVERLTLLFPESFSIQAFSLPMTRAAIKLAEHDPAATVELLRPVEPYDLVFADGFEYVYPAYLRGLAYLQLKQGALAAAEFQKVLDHSGLGGGFVTGALAKLQLARAQVLTHDTKAARKSYEDFLALWKSADPDLPIYKEARAEYAALRKTAQ
jgi:tetratricopeptide (TPR) repeat protein